MGCSKVAREPEKSNFLWLFLVKFVLAVSQVNSIIKQMKGTCFVFGIYLNEFSQFTV